MTSFVVAAIAMLVALAPAGVVMVRGTLADAVVGFEFLTSVAVLVFQRCSPWRLLLPRYRSPRDWERLIAAYALAPEQVRGYLIAGDGSGFARREPRVAPHRFEVYQDALAETPGAIQVGIQLQLQRPPEHGQWDGTLEGVQRRQPVQVILHPLLNLFG